MTVVWGVGFQSNRHRGGDCFPSQRPLRERAISLYCAPERQCLLKESFTCICFLRLTSRDAPQSPGSGRARGACILGNAESHGTMSTGATVLGRSPTPGTVQWERQASSLAHTAYAAALKDIRYRCDLGDLPLPSSSLLVYPKKRKLHTHLEPKYLQPVPREHF